jgi:hypothetical protein
MWYRSPSPWPTSRLYLYGFEENLGSAKSVCTSATEPADSRRLSPLTFVLWQRESQVAWDDPADQLCSAPAHAAVGLGSRPGESQTRTRVSAPSELPPAERQGPCSPALSGPGSSRCQSCPEGQGRSQPVARKCQRAPSPHPASASGADGPRPAGRMPVQDALSPSLES